MKKKTNTEQWVKEFRKKFVKSVDGIYKSEFKKTTWPSHVEYFIQSLIDKAYKEGYRKGKHKGTYGI